MHLPAHSQHQPMRNMHQACTAHSSKRGVKQFTYSKTHAPHVLYKYCPPGQTQ
jgi:hypothetical protein